MCSDAAFDWQIIESTLADMLCTAHTPVVPRNGSALVCWLDRGRNRVGSMEAGGAAERHHVNASFLKRSSELECTDETDRFL